MAMATKEFRDWVLQDAKEPTKVPEWVAVNRAFYEGDHWQQGEGNVGPMLLQAEDGYDTYMSEIERTFMSENVIAEIVDRHVMGAVGREISWGLSPRKALAKDAEIPDAIQRKIDAAGAMLTAWWDRDELNVQAMIQEAVKVLLYAGRSPFGLYVPPGLLVGGRVPRGTIEETLLERIYLRTPMPEQSTIYINPDTRRRVGIYAYTYQEADRAEIVYLDGDRTVLRVLGAGDAPAEEYSERFGRRLPIFEMRRTPLVTAQIRQQQKGLNHAFSMIPRNVTSGGYIEEVMKNVQLPGEMVKDGDGKERFIPDPQYRGPGTSRNLIGVEKVDAAGEVIGYETPDIKWRDPVDTKASESAVMAHYLAILRDADQMHAAIAGDATATGVARVQARAAFVASLRKTVPQVTAAVRWVLETSLAMAEAFAGTPGEYTNDLRVDARCKLDAGPVTPDEQTAISILVDKGLMSKATAMELLGADDADAEASRIQEEEASNLATMKERAEIMQALVRGAGASIMGAALAVGFTEEEARAMQAVDIIDGDTQ